MGNIYESPDKGKTIYKKETGQSFKSRVLVKKGDNMSDNTKEFNKALKEKLEDTFGKEFVNDKIVIMGLNDDKEVDDE